MFCSDAALVKCEGDVRTFSPLYCNAWSCDVCQPRRAARLVREAKEGEPTTFITLTVNPAWGDDPDHRARKLVECWRHIVRAAKAKYGYKKIPYLCVFEATKKGEPHLHILARVRWLDQSWISAKMLELMRSPVVDIRRVWSQSRMANYISKYIGKNPTSFRGVKRYWRTLDYLKPQEEDEWYPDKPVTWFHTSKWHWKILAYEAQEQGYDVEWHRNFATAVWQPP